MPLAGRPLLWFSIGNMSLNSELNIPPSFRPVTICLWTIKTIEHTQSDNYGHGVICSHQLGIEDKASTIGCNTAHCHTEDDA
jgi:hypothetical protein